MFRSVRAVPHIEIEGENDPARVSLFHGELLGNTAALVNGADLGFGSGPTKLIVSTTSPAIPELPTCELTSIASLGAKSGSGGPIRLFGQLATGAS